MICAISLLLLILIASRDPTSPAADQAARHPDARGRKKEKERQKESQRRQQKKTRKMKMQLDGKINEECPKNDLKN